MDEAKNQHWRDKYLALLEQQEHHEKTSGAMLEQLRRTLVRVSLVADGLDSELDQVLDDLRVQLKSNNLQNLDSHLEVVEAAILEFDGRKQQQGARTVDAFESLVEQLMRLNMEKELKKQLKTFGGQVNLQSKNVQDSSTLLHDFSQIQAAVVDKLAIKRPSIFEKLTDITTLLKGSEQDDISVVASPALQKNANDEKDIQCVTEQAATIFSQLLTAISNVAVVEQKIRRVEQRLQKGLTFEELIPSLEDLCDIVMQSSMAHNQEFSQYLTSVNSELEILSKLALSAIGEVDEEEKQKHQLKQKMTSQIQAIEDCINDSSDLETLKNEVRLHIEEIRTAFEKPSVKKSTLSDQVRELLTQVESLEEEAQQTYARLSEQKQKAQHDSLTGLPNREAYNERGEQECQRWQRYQQPLTLAVVDIDLFKRINDSYGHQVGDKVLQLVSHNMRKRLREVDFIARYGGEEFVILLPQTSAEIALSLLDKVREGIAATGFHYKTKPVDISVSIGISEFQDGDLIESVFERADKALYQAKDNGRNCCQVLAK